MPPVVSILLPNLNNRPYLEERIRSIQEQTFTDWELIIVDSYSDDGAWEYFQACAQTEKRIKIYQSPERGIYNNFNKCIRLARGKYIYIATSDDAMTPNALEVMVQALEENPGCDIAHCKLRIVNENNEHENAKTWDNFFIVRYFGDLIEKNHIR
ncbi:MAG: glycosyltransferase family 2 protein, partial [Acidobacteria bacterium]|nr:glycosyltransferase family 2 protein [Acidobacteriota bacterium]